MGDVLVIFEVEEQDSSCGDESKETTRMWAELKSGFFSLNGQALKLNVQIHPVLLYDIKLLASSKRRISS